MLFVIMKSGLAMYKVCCLGPKGTFSHTVAKKIFPQEGGFLFSSTITQVFEEVEKGADFGIVPIENSTNGIIIETLDCAMEKPLWIVSSHKEEIHHHLVAAGGEIKKIKSHPQVLAQCRKWISLNLPHAELEPQESSTTAISKEPGTAFICSREAAEEYGLQIMAENIEDRKGNTTEFYIISKGSREKWSASRTLMIVSLKDRPGILRDILSAFADEDLNLSKLHSRANSVGEKWDYYFFLEIECLPQNESFKKAVQKIEDYCSVIKILGTS